MSHVVPADIQRACIVTTGGTQSRVELSEEAVAEYAQAMTEGVELPPIVVFHDGSAYWLADGFHRVMAANRANVEWMKAEVRVGTKRDAILYSVGANSTHGLPRTNGDKRRSVELLLNDEEWTQWSDREIGRRCCVDHTLVGRIRTSLVSDTSEKHAPKYTTKHGTHSTMKTEHIGKNSKARENYKPKLEREAEIQELADQGYTKRQISEKLKIGEEQIWSLCKKAGIEIPADKVVGPSKRISNRRVIEQTVLSMEASAQSLNTVPISFDGIDVVEAKDWLQSVTESIRIFSAFRKQLAEVANG